MDARPSRPRVLVVDESPRQRLRVVAALSSRFDVYPLPAGDDPLRTARARRPDLVLFAIDRGNADEVLRYCRTLRTDVRPIERVAVYTPRAPRPADVVTETWRADGYLAAPFDAAAILAFSEAVLRGDRPVQVRGDGDGVVGRLFDRLRRR